LIKIDCDFESEKSLFTLKNGKQICIKKTKDVDPTFKTVEFRYFLTDGTVSFELANLIKLGLFEPSGWNYLSVVNNNLKIN